MIRSTSNPVEARHLARDWGVLEGVKHPVLKELELSVFYGGTVFILDDVALICARFGKRKKNVWEPVLNWYVSYTLEAERRKGYATTLFRHVETLAADAGCRRVRSLAGSRAGLALHFSLSQGVYGLTPNGEAVIHEPLPGYTALYTGKVPPEATENKPWKAARVRAQIKEGLRYDR